jgi:O-antigen/teichoic acid export membrane protein
MIWIQRLLTKSHLVSTGATDATLVILATITGILVARLLGPEGRGQFAIAILWPSVIVAIGNLGLREAFTYEQAKNPEIQSKLTGHMIILAICQAVILMAIGLLLIPLLTQSHTSEVTNSSLIFLLVIPANLLAIYGLGLLQGSLHISLFNAIRLSVNLVYLLGVSTLWLLGSVTVWTITLSLLVANIVTSILSVTAAIQQFGITWRIDLNLTRRLFAYGIRNHTGNLSFMLNQRMDQMLMAVLITPVQLGWYTAAVNVSSLTRLASGAFGTLVFPKVASSVSSDQQKVTILYSRLNATLTYGICIFLLITIPILIPLLYGEAYIPSIVPALILTIATVFVALGQAWAGSLRGLGSPFIPAKAELISLVITVIGLALTLRTWGIMGATVTSLIAYLVASAYMYAQLHRLLSVSLYELLLPISPAIQAKLAISIIGKRSVN